MKLHSYINEIADIAAANDVGWWDAAAMFLANVRGAGDPEAMYHYAGADDRVDYEALKPHLKELEASGEEFVVDYRTHGKALRALRAKGDYEGAKAMMEAAAGE